MQSRLILPSALLAASSLGLGGVARAQFSLSELLINPPGSDDGQEGVEIRGPANASLAGYWLLTVDGDGTSAGVIDVRQDLGAYSTGSNGLLLIRDAASVIAPAPDPATSVVVFNWTPDIENGTNTYVLGFGTPPAAGTDIDANDDGTIDTGALVGFTDVDAVTLIEEDVGATNLVYSDDFGCFACPQLAFTPDALYAIYNADGTPCSWTGGDIVGTNPGGPYTWDFGTTPTDVFGGLTGGGLDLGNLNIILDADSDGIADGCEPFTQYCFGDGTLATACPCGNTGAAGKGCENSAATGGAMLDVAGGVSPDTVVLTSMDELPTVLSIFVQGDADNASGTAFGDGVLCIAGNLKRMYVKHAVAGTVSAPEVGDPTITAQSAALGDTIVPGSTRYYQVYYRDPDLAFCAQPAGDSFNVSNGVQIVW